jgi:hypothetical protein
MLKVINMTMLKKVMMWIAWNNDGQGSASAVIIINCDSNDNCYDASRR